MIKVTTESPGWWSEKRANPAVKLAWGGPQRNTPKKGVKKESGGNPQYQKKGEETTRVGGQDGVGPHGRSSHVVNER